MSMDLIRWLVESTERAGLPKVSMEVTELRAILDALERAEREMEEAKQAFQGEIGRARAVHRQALAERDVEIETMRRAHHLAVARAERVEAAARDLYEHYGADAEVILGPELRATLADAPETE